MTLKYEITPENLKVLEIKQITLNTEKFGALVFEKAYPQLHEVRKQLVELEELEYATKLIPDEINNIGNLRKTLIGFLVKINNLDPKTDPSFNVNIRNNLEQEINGFYNHAVSYMRGFLVYLRQEATLKTEDQQSLAEDRKKASVTLKQAESTLSLLQGKIEDLNKREKELQNTAGKVGAGALGIHFRTETEQYQKKADKWFVGVIVGYVCIIVGLLSVALYYHNKGWQTMSWQAGTAKLIFFLSLWYGLSFFIRNYNVNSHLAAVNRHRSAVAGTLEDFLAASPRQQEMLKNATEAMFKHAPVGFITRAEKESGNPIFEIINKIAKSE
jgi:hypothetical protein